MHKTLLRVALSVALFSPLSVLLPTVALADTVQTTFEAPTYSVGSINGQDGWMKTGTFDANVIATGVANFGAQSLQISDAVTSGTFGDQTFSKPLTNSVGETSATAGSFAAGTKQSHFEMQFDLASAVPGAQQPGETMSVSPDRGDGSRMSYLRFEDQADGIHVYFDDVTDAGPVGTTATFNESDIATLDRSIPHTIKLTLDTIDGPANDVVKVYIDGTLKKTGTSWEDYYRFDNESASEQSPRIVKTVLFRESSTANPADAGKGYLVDNLTLTSGPTPAGSTTIVTPSNAHSWVIDDTRPGGASSIIADATGPAGIGALQLTTDSTTAAKAQFMQYVEGLPVPLSSVTQLSYYTKQNSAGFAGGDASYQLPTMLNGSTGFTTFVFEPYENGSVTAGVWQQWDVAKGQFWSSKTVTCSNGTITAGFGGAPFYTLAQIQAICPSATVVGFGVNIGSNNPSYNVETDLVSFNNTAYNFEPDPIVVPPTSVKVTIEKFVNNAAATAGTTGGASFSMHAVYPGGEGDYALSTVGFNNPDPYKATTADMPVGSNYSTYENPAESCTSSYPFVFNGYSVGDTLAGAESAATSTTVPAFENLQGDKYVVVWNRTCPPAPTITTPADGSTLTSADAVKVDWTDVTDPATPITYLYEASNAPATNTDGSFATTLYQSGVLTDSEIPTPNTPEGVYYVHARAVDAAGNAGPWSATTKITIANTPPPANYKVHIAKYLDGVQATATAANNYLFPMTATWNATNIGAGSGAYTLGSNWGGASDPYQADTAAMTGPFDYTTSEITDASSQVVPIGGQCAPGKYQLVGYTSSAQAFDTNPNDVTATPPAYSQVSADQYVVVWNVKCPTSASLTITKSASGGNGTFAFTSDIPGHPNFTITTANNTGSVNFTGITPGTYHVTETPLKGWTQTDTSCDTVALAAGDDVQCTVINTNNKLLGSIRGTKYEDRDGDGTLKDGDHHRLGGVTIYIDKNNNGVLDTGDISTVTNSHGLYIFPGLVAGTYRVREVVQAGWTQSYPVSGSWTVTLAAGQNAKQKDFGNFKAGTVSGMKFNDLNGNHRKDPNEPGLAGWTITISGIRFSASTVTDANGNYSFTNLRPGTYTLTETMKSGWRQTLHPSTITVRSSSVITNKNFGNTQKVKNRGDRDNDDQYRD